MKLWLIALISLSAFAQNRVTVGIQADPCALVQRSNDLVQDFGGLCKYEKQNKALPAATTRRVVYFGDSITELWRNGIPGLVSSDTINRGYSGQTTAQMKIRFRADVIKLKPRIVHIMAGTNDIAGNTGPTTLERIKDNFRSMFEEAKRHGIRVVIGSVLPARAFSWRPGIRPANTIRTLNAWLKSYAKTMGHEYVDYHSALTENDGGLPLLYSRDGVHPTPAGYAVMRRLAQDAIIDSNRR